MHGHLKRRGRPTPGSIPEALDIFRSEVRFYREIAPVIGVRVPACYHSEDTAEPAVAVQGLLSMSDTAPGSAAAAGWASRLAAAAARLSR